jgi:dolichyl-phosphate-mannose--protein O-mannosyl transferase
MSRRPSISAWIFTFILLFALGTRLWRLGIPDGYYFDEVYHAVTAKLILHNDPRAYEWTNPPPEPNTAVDWLHPPLAKLTQAAGMKIFGENGFGWRISAAVFGTGTIVLTYFLAIELGLPVSVALLAMGLLSLDGLALTTSRIAMNDAHVTFFFVLTAWLYRRWKKRPTEIRTLATAAAAGLAAASKWSGVFISGVIVIDQLIGLVLDRHHWRRKIAPFLSLLGTLIILVPSLYLLSYSQMFAQGKTWQHFRELHRQIWWYQTNLKATHPYQSTPLQWVLDLRPVYVYADYDEPGVLRNIYMLGNPLIFWGGAAAALWSLSQWLILLQQRQPTEKVKREAEQWRFLLLAYLLPWVPWMASPRIMFFYHYLPAVPFLCLLLAWQLNRLARSHSWGKWLAVGFVALTAAAFLAFFPNWTALPVPESWGQLYFLLPGWR